jgi:hypothetical protein
LEIFRQIMDKLAPPQWEIFLLFSHL